MNCFKICSKTLKCLIIWSLLQAKIISKIISWFKGHQLIRREIVLETKMVKRNSMMLKLTKLWNIKRSLSSNKCTPFQPSIPKWYVNQKNFQNISFSQTMAKRTKMLIRCKMKTKFLKLSQSTLWLAEQIKWCERKKICKLTRNK